MRAVVLREPGRPVEVEEVELDPPRDDEVLVRVAAAGVCHSDVRLADGELGPGRWPMVLGHEGAGVVEEVGARVTHVAPGDHVCFSLVPACRACPACRAGHPNLCEPAGRNGVAGMLLDGTSRLHANGTQLQHGLMTACFAERTVVAAAGAVPIPRELPLWQAALLGCAAITGFGAVRNVARVAAGESVAVVGCGGVGLNMVQAAAVAGAAEIVAVDPSPAKHALAREMGATRACSPEEAAESVRVDYSFEAVGPRATIELAISLVARGGQAILVGMAPPDARPGFDALSLTMEEKAIRGCWYGSCRPQADFPMLVSLYTAGKLRLGSLVEPCALDDVNAAFDRMRRGEAVRSVIVY
jgi:S-(hydroxymethyl)glutathione dehydrogenase / alcohol dehydrogenase